MDGDTELVRCMEECTLLAITKGSRGFGYSPINEAEGECEVATSTTSAFYTVDKPGASLYIFGRVCN